MALSDKLNAVLEAGQVLEASRTNATSKKQALETATADESNARETLTQADSAFDAAVAAFKS